MAKDKTFYALSKLSGPAGFILPGAALDDLDADTISVLVDEGSATDDAELAAAAEASYVGAPGWGTTTGGLEVVDLDEVPLPLPVVEPDVTVPQE